MALLSIFITIEYSCSSLKGTAIGCGGTLSATSTWGLINCQSLTTLGSSVGKFDDVTHTNGSDCASGSALDWIWDLSLCSDWRQTSICDCNSFMSSNSSSSSSNCWAMSSLSNCIDAIGVLISWAILAARLLMASNRRCW